MELHRDTFKEYSQGDLPKIIYLLLTRDSLPDKNTMLNHMCYLPAMGTALIVLHNVTYDKFIHKVYGRVSSSVSSSSSPISFQYLISKQPFLSVFGVQGNMIDCLLKICL